MIYLSVSKIKIFPTFSNNAQNIPHFGQIGSKDKTVNIAAFSDFCMYLKDQDKIKSISSFILMNRYNLHNIHNKNTNLE